MLLARDIPTRANVREVIQETLRQELATAVPTQVSRAMSLNDNLINTVKRIATAHSTRPASISKEERNKLYNNLHRRLQTTIHARIDEQVTAALGDDVDARLGAHLTARVEKLVESRIAASVHSPSLPTTPRSNSLTLGGLP